MSLNQDSKCDCDCKGCFRYPERKSGLRNLLNMKDYIRLIENFKDAGGLAIEISGEGEPLLSKYTLPIIRMASGEGIWTTLITNGHQLEKEMIIELAALKVALVLSLHSMIETNYDVDCGSIGKYRRKMTVIEEVADIFRDTERKENGYIVKRAAIHWTLQANNLDQVDLARKFCDYRKLLFSIAPLAKTGHAANRPELWPEDQRLESVNALGDESIIFYEEPDGRRVCGTCKYGLNIGADGNLLLDAHGGYEVEIANIRKISFAKAIALQHNFAAKMFGELDSFCPVRDPKWSEFLAKKRYL